MNGRNQPIPAGPLLATVGTAVRSAGRLIWGRFVAAVDEPSAEMDEAHRLAAEIFWWDPRTMPR
jgi:hypothetical protein